MWELRTFAGWRDRNIAAMNPIVGWALAAAAVAAAWYSYGWQGLVLAATLIFFWLVLQFNRSLRVMKNAAGKPVGHVDSAVMFNAKLKPGMNLLEVITMTKSLGRRVSDEPEVWAWTDAGGVTVTLTLKAGKLERWELARPDAAQ